MSVREKVLSDLDTLNEAQIKKVSDYVKFLQFQGKKKLKKQMAKKTVFSILAKSLLMSV